MIFIDHSIQKGKSFDITFTGGTKMRLPEELVFKYSIFPGSQFSHNAWQEILESKSKYECFEHTLRILSAKNHSEFEIRKKLNKKGFNSKIIDPTIEKAKELDLINDFSLVNHFIHRQLELGKIGRNRIIRKLQQRGIDPEMIRINIKNLYSQQTEESSELIHALKVGEGKLRLLARENDARKKKEKLLRFLANRGFPTSICYDVANQLLRENIPDTMRFSKNDGGL